MSECQNCASLRDKFREDMGFVKTYCNGLEGMKALLTRERNEARADVATRDKLIVELEGRIAKLEDVLDLVRRYNVPTTEEALRDWFDAMRKKHEAVKSELEATIEHGRKTIEAEMNARFALERDLGAKNDRVTELEKRIMELTAPVDANGKTPGQVAFEGWSSAFIALYGGTASIWDPAMDKIWEPVAQAVLRASVNRAESAANDAVEALRRVRDKFDNLDRANTFGFVVGIAEIIDAEIAKLDTKPTRSPPDTSTESGLPDAVLQVKP